MVYDGPPPRNTADEAELAELLERFQKRRALALAGAPLPFIAEAALNAARVVELAGWYLVSRTGAPEELERDLVVRAIASGPAEHLSADLTLQYLPSIYERARALDPGDRFVTFMAEILRRWPLSGVLADLPDAPSREVNFGCHPGLLFLYAERLAENFKPAWIPRDVGFAHLELVWTELGRDPALLAAPATMIEEQEP